MRTLILALVASIALYGDAAPPALVWIGDPIVSDNVSGGFTPDANGINVGFDFSDSLGLHGLTAFRFFDVLSPGTFIATSTLTVDLSAEVCPGDTMGFGCPGVSLNVDVSDSFNSFLNSQAVPPVLDPAVDCNYPGNLQGTRNCGGVDLTFSATKTSTVFLPVGDYILSQGLEVDTDGAQASSDLSFSFQSDLVPTPEPQGYAVLLAVALAGCIAFRFRAIGPGPHC